MTRIRKGANPVKIPFQIKCSDRTLAAWCNEVRVALQQINSRIPTTNIVRPSSASVALQFKIYGVRYDSVSETYFCKVRPGYVRNRNADSAATEPVKDWMPTVGDPAVALNAAEAPEIEIADGQTVYCRVATTSKGIIEAAPKIEAAATPQAGVHFQPPNADAEGDLYFPLANITITGDPAVVTLEQIQQGGPINVTPNLPEIKNVGGKREVFKAREPEGDSYEFRTLEQLDGGGAAVLKPLGGSGGEGDTIKIRDIKKNNSGSVPYTIQGDGDSVKVTFSGLDGSYIDAFGGAVNFAAGIATGTTPASLTGLTASFNWTFTPPGVSDPEEMRLTFDNGVLTGATRKASGGVHVAVATGAAVTFSSYDT